MSKTETTFEQYDAYSKATGVKQKKAEWGRDKMPVLNVSWNDIQGYLKWLNSSEKSNLNGLQCRLPSEVEWEYAARSGLQTNYPWGDDIGKNTANCRDCGNNEDGKKTTLVASFSPNDFGLHDMNGNVWEWVEDCWHDNYQDAPITAKVWEEEKCESRVLRGGSWDNSSASVRSAVRDGSNPSDSYFNLGFRIICALPFSEKWATDN